MAEQREKQLRETIFSRENSKVRPCVCMPIYVCVLMCVPAETNPYPPFPTFTCMFAYSHTAVLPRPQVLKEQQRVTGHRARQWLLLTVHFSRMRVLSKLYHDVVKPAREARAMKFLNTKQKDAVLIIESWWRLA